MPETIHAILVKTRSRDLRKYTDQETQNKLPHHICECDREGLGETPIQ